MSKCASDGELTTVELGVLGECIAGLSPSGEIWI